MANISLTNLAKLNLVAILKENSGHSCQTKMFEGPSMGSPSSFNLSSKISSWQFFLANNYSQNPNMVLFGVCHWKRRKNQTGEAGAKIIKNAFFIWVSHTLGKTSLIDMLCILWLHKTFYLCSYVLVFCVANSSTYVVLKVWVTKSKLVCIGIRHCHAIRSMCWCMCAMFDILWSSDSPVFTRSQFQHKQRTPLSLNLLFLWLLRNFRFNSE